MGVYRSYPSSLINSFSRQNLNLSPSSKLVLFMDSSYSNPDPNQFEEGRRTLIVWGFSSESIGVDGTQKEFLLCINITQLQNHENFHQSPHTLAVDQAHSIFRGSLFYLSSDAVAVGCRLLKAQQRQLKFVVTQIQRCMIPISKSLEVSQHFYLVAPCEISEDRLVSPSVSLYKLIFASIFHVKVISQRKSAIEPVENSAESPQEKTEKIFCCR